MTPDEEEMMQALQVRIAELEEVVQIVATAQVRWPSYSEPILYFPMEPLEGGTAEWLLHRSQELMEKK